MAEDLLALAEELRQQCPLDRRRITPQRVRFIYSVESALLLRAADALDAAKTEIDQLRQGKAGE